MPQFTIFTQQPLFSSIKAGMNKNFRLTRIGFIYFTRNKIIIRTGSTTGIHIAL